MLACLFTSCASTAKLQKHRESKADASDVLAAEQQRKYDYFFLEANRLKAKGDYDAAFDLFNHCLALNPNAASALYEISQFYLSLKQIPLGQGALEKAVANAPENYWYSQALANLYQQQGKKKEAVAVLESMVPRFPDRRESLFTLVDLYTQLKDYEKVISTLNRLEDILGKNEQLSMEKFRIYLQMEDDKKAFQEIESLAKEYPTDMRYLALLGDVYLQNGKNKEAYDTYQKVLAIEPDNAMALFSLASYYEQTGQKELYEQQLDTLLLNKKVPAETKVNVMREFIVQSEQAGKDSLQVINIFNRMMQQDADDTQIPMLYAQYLLSKGMEKESIPVLEQVVQIDPTNTAARMMLLGSAVRKNDYEQVIKICEPGVEATPESIEFYYYLGIAYYQAERLDDALNIYKKGLTHVTADSKKEVVSDFYSMLGDIYHTKKQLAEAYAAYDSSLVYNPSNVGALNNYAYYLSVEKRDLDKAEEMSYKTVKAEPNNSTYLDTYAWILFEKGNYAEARIYMDDAMKNGGDQSDVIVEHCGDIYYMLGDVDGAMKYWNKALGMDSKSTTLKLKIAKKKYIAE
ncbi:tetratricopeptide repeat protein [uncultured Bacteroides sp.]|uniref:tetratricopeptide repeat protein n=1 Tax=uncultured Bacteroides sp. TaxID=162156 RepID=UPI002AA96145|nr:tetratricopeptide repeat protein [uncultured Bacteroides sp.]